MRFLTLTLFSFFTLTLAMAQTDGMKQRWKKIDDFLDQSLPKSALTELQLVYKEAKEKNDPDNQIKALIYIMRCNDMSEEDAFEKDIAFVRQEIETASFPANAILQSMLGEMYWQYFQRRRYRSDISASTNVDEADIQTWDQKTLLEASIKAYKASLKEKDALLKFNTDVFQQLIHKSVNHAYTANLYDFLGKKALDFFKSGEASVSRPAEQFNLNNVTYFSSSPEFIALNIQSHDAISLHLYAIQLMQDLERVHIKDTDQTILIDLVLNRLKFVSANTGLSNASDLMLPTLIKLEQNSLKLPASTDVSFEIAVIWHERSKIHSGINNTYTYPDANIKSIQICDAAITRFPNSDGAYNCDNLKGTILKPSLELMIEEVNLPMQPFRTRVTYNNVSNVSFRIISLTPDEVEKLKNDLEYRYDVNRLDLFKPYIERTPIKKWSVDLIKDPELREHTTEVAIEALPTGMYLILASDVQKIEKEKAILGYNFTSVSNISFIARSVEGKAQLYVLSRDTGKPVKDAKVRAFTLEYDYTARKNKKKIIGEFISDANGYVEAFVSDNKRSSYVNFDISTKTDRLICDSRRSSGFYLYKEEDYSNDPFYERSMLLFTDRSIYRPGQTIYFKGIVYDTKGKNTFTVSKKTQVRVTLYDANYKEVSYLDLVTNEFGSVQGSFTAPVGSLTGTMHISGDNMGNAYFSVEEYKRPKFEVQMQPLTGQYKLNQQVQVKAVAKAYAGNAVDGAEVTYRVVRRAQIPYWYSKYWSNYDTQETVIATGTTVTDHEGAFTVTFTALPDASVSPDSKPTFVYTVYADVIDINGETHSDELSVSIGYSSLNLSIQVPATVEKGKATTLYVKASNQSGQPEAATVRVQVFKLEAPKKVLRSRFWNAPDKPLLSEAEFHKIFPEDEYENETQIENYPQKLILETVLHTSVDKAGELVLPDNWETGQYLVKVSALDADKVESTDQANFTKTDPHSDKLPYAMAAWTKISPGSVEPKGKATFELGSSFSDIHVICEIERNGIIIRKEFLSVKNDIKHIEQLITEEDRGGLAIHYAFVHNNRVYTGTSNIYVPFTNKELDIHWETFRNKLLPGQAEEWRLIIKKTNGEKMAAEFLATMYDASLDAFRPHDWSVHLYSSNSSRLSWNNYHNTMFGYVEFTIWDYYRSPGYGAYKYYDQFNWFDYAFGRNYGGYGRNKEMAKKSMAPGARSTSTGMAYEESEMSVSLDSVAAAPASNATFKWTTSAGNAGAAMPEKSEATKSKEIQQPAIRKDFRETAFFFPDLKTDSAGNIVLRFSMPEALTRWKLMALAHTKDMSYGTTQQEVVTQKDLMVVPNAPRFLREGDKLILTAKVTNLSGSPLKGTVTLQLFDAATMKPIDKELGNTDAVKFFGDANTPSEVKSWSIKVPGGYQAITYRVVATAGNFSDGEENIIPVFSNRMLVTESVPMVVTKGQTKTYNLDKLATHKSATLVNHRLTLELTPNPVWYAVQALPYLAEYPYECAEQTFSRYYANSLAGFVANSSPALKRMFELWKDLEPDALLSNLEKNQELKMLLLEQTPWLRDAENETEQKRRIGLLFDLTRMNSEMDRAIGKLEKMQLGNGAFPWFTGMHEDRYITQHILTGLGHLKHLGIQGRNDEQIADMTEKALSYCDAELLKDYKELLDRAKRKEVILEEVRPSSMEVHYLYGRSFYQRNVEGDLAKALQYYKDQSRKYWTEYSLYEQGLIGLTAYRDGNTQLSGLMHKSFKERAIMTEDKGMYWKPNEGYYWYQAPIERQALLIEFFEEAAKDRASVDNMRFWLLTQKQTTHWKTTKATTEACYALLLNGTSWLNEDPTLSVSVGNTKVEFPKSELDPTKTKVWNGTEVKPEMSKVTLSKQGEGIAWGALHWQYYEDLDKITTHKNTQVQLTKELMLVVQTDSGTVLTPITANTVLKPGDLVKVKLIIRTDRDLEYVHVQDMRAAGFEPLNVLSGAKWNNSFGYYESTRDASTDFFIGYLPRGTYVFEYSLRVNNAGDFSNGITNIQCMYAPEFNAHSQGIRVEIK